MLISMLKLHMWTYLAEKIEVAELSVHAQTHTYTNKVHITQYDSTITHLIR